MSAIGSIRITIRTRDGEITGADVQSARAIDTARLFKGRGKSEAMALNRALFGICPAAQSLACELAFDAALGKNPQNEELRGLEADNALETLRENLMLFGLRVPGTLKTEARAPFVKAIQALCAGSVSLGSDTLPSVLEPVRALLLGALPEGAQSLEAGFVPGSPWGDFFVSLENDPLKGKIEDSLILPKNHDIAENPNVLLQVRAFTGALQRSASSPYFRKRLAKDGNTTFLRLAARFSETLGLLASPEKINQGSAAVATGCRQGAGIVQTARGTLVHKAVLTPEGRLADYEILSPTEINFGDFSSLKKLLIGTKFKNEDTLSGEISLLMASFDPCLPYEVEINHA